MHMQGRVVLQRWRTTSSSLVKSSLLHTPAPAPAPAYYVSPIRECLKNAFEKRKEEVKKLRLKYKDHSLGDYTVNQCVFGGHEIPALFNLITYKNNSLECEHYVHGKTFDVFARDILNLENQYGTSSTREIMLWYLITGCYPSRDEAEMFAEDLNARSTITPDIMDFIGKLPIQMNMLSRLSCTLLFCRMNSKFSIAHQTKVDKETYWEFFLEDSLLVLAKLPRLITLICGYSNSQVLPVNTKLLNYLYILYGDDGGSNACSHAVHLAGSVLADAYQSLSAGLNSISGGGYLGNEYAVYEALMINVREKQGDISKVTYCLECMLLDLSTSVVGNRNFITDNPKYSFLVEYCHKNASSNQVLMDFIKYLDMLYSHQEQLMSILQIDRAIVLTFALLHCHDIQQKDSQKAILALSLASGSLAQMIWDRCFRMLLENPKSGDMSFIMKKIHASSQQ